MTRTLPPSFFLYGEAPKAANPDFIHIESLAERSRPGKWRIAPHKHGDLNHIMLITEGGGSIRFETKIIEFTAPKLLIVPSSAIHGFAWQHHSAGSVLTIVDLQLEQILTRYGELSQLFDAPSVVDIDAVECQFFVRDLEAIRDELSWVALGRNAALDALLVQLMVRSARAMQSDGEGKGKEPRSSTVVARYRQLLEARFRQREPIAAYASELAVSETTLRQACASVGQSPIEMRDARAILEAQRLLAFSTQSVAEIGASIGILDPAYFSRFFLRKCGVSPAHWRRDLAQNRRKSGAQSDL